jgi:hypothetical protein
MPNLDVMNPCLKIKTEKRRSVLVASPKNEWLTSATFLAEGQKGKYQRHHEWQRK